MESDSSPLIWICTKFLHRDPIKFQIPAGWLTLHPHLLSPICPPTLHISLMFRCKICSGRMSAAETVCECMFVCHKTPLDKKTTDLAVGPVFHLFTLMRPNGKMFILGGVFQKNWTLVNTLQFKTYQSPISTNCAFQCNYMYFQLLQTETVVTIPLEKNISLNFTFIGSINSRPNWHPVNHLDASVWSTMSTKITMTAALPFKMFCSHLVICQINVKTQILYLSTILHCAAIVVVGGINKANHFHDNNLKHKKIIQSKK